MRISVVYALCACLAIILVLFAVRQSCYRVRPYVFDSGTPGKTLLIVAGVHGNEPSGPRALMNMIRNRDIHATSGRVIIIPYANWCGWLVGKRRVPAKGEDKDLNRHFTADDPTGLARDILGYVKQADYVLDLHESEHYYQNRLGEELYNGRTLWSNKHRLLNERVRIDINNTIDSEPPFVLDIAAAAPLDDMLRDFCLVHQIPYLLVETCKTDSLEERVMHNEAAVRSMIHNVGLPS